MEIQLLNRIKSPEDVKKLSRKEIDRLIEEIRYTLIETVSNTGGHLASNLGVVELTVAMHTVFNSPKDSFVWDVGHQVYTHKLLTGRYDRFPTLRQDGGLSGFPNPEESEHDFFAAGHSGTSVAAAYGLSVAKTLQHDRSNTVAVIGDGSFTGGLVYEAMNNAGNKDTHLIVILNENEMSISPNVGALAVYLAALRTHPKYYKMKGEVKEAIRKMPVRGEKTLKTLRAAKKRLKDRLYSSTFFEDMGFSYMGPIDGHDFDGLCDALESAKSFDTPVLLHVKTKKGKGYEFAECHPCEYHGTPNFDAQTGIECGGKAKNFSSEFGRYLVKFAEEDDRICAITAAMEVGTGLDCFAKRFANRFFDVGIAEEFATTFAGGLAKGGMIPVFAVYSTFLQRAYDEIVHDVSMQNVKVIFAVDRAGFVGEDGRSHQGIFDIAFMRTIPGSVIYSPSTYKEMGFYLYRALYDEGKVISVRYPRGKEGYLPESFEASYEDYTVLGDSDSDITLVTFGGLFSEAGKAMEELAEEGVRIKLLKLNKIWPVSEDTVKEALDSGHILFFEEGVKSGGIGEYFGFELLKHKFEGEYTYFGVDNTFVHHAPIASLRKEFHLDKDAMKEEILRRVKGEK